VTHNSERFLVTGANGFVGTALVRRLRACGLPVRSLVRRPSTAPPLEALGSEVVLGDVRDKGAVLEASRGCTRIVHTAAWVGADGDPKEIEATNIGGTRNVLNAALSVGAKQLMHISSTAVYGSPSGMDITEKQTRRLSGQPYHDSKVRAEDVVLNAPESLSIAILRPSHIFGPESTHFTLRPLSMLRGRVLLIDGGHGHFKPIYIDNLLDLMEGCFADDTPAHIVVNATDGYVKTWRELFTDYASALGLTPNWLNIPYPLAAALARLAGPWRRLTGKKALLSPETLSILTSHNSYSNLKAQRELGWSPAVTWDQAMTKTADWVREQGGMDALFSGAERQYR